MTNEEIKKRVLFALRKIKIVPDALLWINATSEGVYDLDIYINHIPIYYTDIDIINIENLGVNIECPFIPIWRDECSNKPSLTKDFVKYFGDEYND